MHFLYRLFCPKEICLTFTFYLKIVNWVHFRYMHTFTYQKTLLQILFCLFLKSSKAFSVSLNKMPIRQRNTLSLKFVSYSRGSQTIIRWLDSNSEKIDGRGKGTFHVSYPKVTPNLWFWFKKSGLPSINKTLMQSQKK